MKTDSGLFTLIQLKDNQPVNYRNKTSLIFVNNPSKPHGKQLGFFMKVIEDLNTKSTSSVIDQIHYGKVPQEFSGMVLYFTIGKIYINGYVYQSGKVVRQVTLNNGNNMANTYRPQTVKINGTSCEVVNVYKNYCEWGGTADNPYENFHGCTQTFVGVAVTCITTTSDEGQVNGDEGTGGDGNSNTGNDNSNDDGCPVNNGDNNEPQGPSAIIYDDSNPCPIVKHFQDTIISDNFAINLKAMCALQKLMFNSYYQNSLNKFIGEDKPIDLRFKLEPINERPGFITLGNTITNPRTWNANMIDLTLNSNRIDSISSLQVALTLLHEGIHAEIFRKLLSIQGPYNLDINNFPSLFNNYSNYKFVNDHQFMADYYISIMSKALMQYDGNKYDSSYYEALSWSGLMGTDAWKAKSDTNSIKIKINQVLNGRSKIGCND